VADQQRINEGVREVKRCFVDTETTGLEVHRHHVWEVAVIVREDGRPDEEFVWQVRPDLATADQEALEIGRFWERFALGERHMAAAMPTSGQSRYVPCSLRDALFDIADLLDKAELVGSNPGFDARFIDKLLRAHEIPFTAHYRPLDVATLAAGWCHDPLLMARDSKPVSSRWVSRQMGVEPPADGVAHTALGDARWARDLFDACTRGAQ
jgi:DNA polymerase III epsilon subunit-like protein